MILFHMISKKSCKLMNSNSFYYFLEIRKFLNMHSIIKYLRLKLKERPKNLSSKVKSYLVYKVMFFYLKILMKKKYFSMKSLVIISYLPDLVVVIPSKFDVSLSFYFGILYYKINDYDN